MGDDYGGCAGVGGDPRVYHMCISDRGPVVKVAVGGYLMEVMGPKFQSNEDFGGLRGVIRDFTAGSRRRLQRKLASINEFEVGLPDFVTLTYPAEYSWDWRDWKRHLHNFIKALVRAWPRVWGVWRLEFQERGAPHFHFLLWDGPQVDGIEVWYETRKKIVVIPDASSKHNIDVFMWMSETWYRVVRSGDPKHLAAGTRIEPIQTWNGVRYYSSKYLAKLPSGKFVPSEYDGTGRFWGVIGKKRWKVTFLEETVPETVFFKIKRVIRKRLERKGIDIGRMKRRINQDMGVTTFIDSKTALMLLTWAWDEVGYVPF